MLVPVCICALCPALGVKGLFCFIYLPQIDESLCLHDTNYYDFKFQVIKEVALKILCVCVCVFVHLTWVSDMT